jgi:hypothetical protein
MAGAGRAGKYQVTTEKRPQFLVPDLTGFTVRMSLYGY